MFVSESTVYAHILYMHTHTGVFTSINITPSHRLISNISASVSQILFHSINIFSFHITLAYLLEPLFNDSILETSIVI